MTIAMRFLRATLQRMSNFMTAPPEKPWPLTDEKVFEIARRIASEEALSDSSAFGHTKIAKGNTQLAQSKKLAAGDILASDQIQP